MSRWKQSLRAELWKNKVPLLNVHGSTVLHTMSELLTQGKYAVCGSCVASAKRVGKNSLSMQRALGARRARGSSSAAKPQTHVVLIGSRAQYTIITFNTSNKDGVPDRTQLPHSWWLFPVLGEHRSSTSSSVLTYFDSSDIGACCCGTDAFVVVFRVFF